MSLVPGIKMDALRLVRQGVYASETEESKVNDSLSSDSAYSESTIFLLQKDEKESEEIWKNRVEILKKAFKDKVVVDLGSGAGGSIYWLASALGAKAYIGVDKNNANLFFGRNGPFGSRTIGQAGMFNIRGKFGNPEPILYSIVQEDMVSFLKRLPDNSVSLVAYGIDGFVFDKTPEDKIREICCEMGRVIAVDGGYLNGVETIIFPQVRGDESRGLFEIISLSPTGKFTMGSSTLVRPLKKD
jgi:SAM-dependent methyltransferase